MDITLLMEKNFNDHLLVSVSCLLGSREFTAALNHVRWPPLKVLLNSPGTDPNDVFICFKEGFFSLVWSDGQMSPKSTRLKHKKVDW